MKHLWTKTNCKPKEWRRIFKALYAFEYLIKNGAPRVIQDIKDDLFKIRSLQDFSYSENGSDKGQGIRDKSRSICELLSDNTKLQEEREFARKTRDKFQGISSTGAETGYMGTGGGSSYKPAGPASGKYGGFGSEDIAKFGYQPGKFNTPYDPYTSKKSSTTKPEADIFSKPSKKKHRKKKKKEESSSDEDSDDSSSSSEESEEEEDKKKKKKSDKKKAKVLEKAPKAERKLSNSNTNVAPEQQPNLLDMMENQPAAN